MSGYAHPVIAVVDKHEGATVVWHVQTEPDPPSGALSGAWILGEGEVDPARLPDLLAGAVELDAHGSGLADIAAAIAASLAQTRAFARAAVAADKKLTAPRFDAPVDVDVEKLSAAFHGEDIARHAWATATALAELVEYWHTLERQRRGRKYLQEEYGSAVRPLPLP